MNRTKALLAIFTVIAVAAIGATTAVAAVSPTEWQASFDASGWIDYVGPGEAPPPSSTAIFDHDGGVITGVTVVADEQHIEGTLSELVLCKSGDCENRQSHGFVPTRVVAIQSYDMHITAASITQVPYTLPSSTGGKGLIAEVISGPVIGDVHGAFVTGEGDGKTAGSVGLGLDGTAAFACFAPSPGPLEPCMTGDGVMLPLNLDFLAEGVYAIDVTEYAGADPGATVFELGNLELEMLLNVDLTGLAQHSPNAIQSEGVMTISDTVISFE